MWESMLQNTHMLMHAYYYVLMDNVLCVVNILYIKKIKRFIPPPNELTLILKYINTDIHTVVFIILICTGYDSIHCHTVSVHLLARIWMVKQYIIFFCFSFTVSSFFFFSLCVSYNSLCVLYRVESQCLVKIPTHTQLTLILISFFATIYKTILIWINYDYYCSLFFFSLSNQVKRSKDYSESLLTRNARKCGYLWKGAV